MPEKELQAACEARDILLTKPVLQEETGEYVTMERSKADFVERLLEHAFGAWVGVGVTLDASKPQHQEQRAEEAVQSDTEDRDDERQDEPGKKAVPIGLRSPLLSPPNQSIPFTVRASVSPATNLFKAASLFNRTVPLGGVRPPGPERHFSGAKSSAPFGDRVGPRLVAAAKATQAASASSFAKRASFPGGPSPAFMAKISAKMPGPGRFSPTGPTFKPTPFGPGGMTGGKGSSGQFGPSGKAPSAGSFFRGAFASGAKGFKGSAGPSFKAPPRAGKGVRGGLESHYRVLGLPPGAGAEEVRRAYRKLALQYHPDKNPDPEAQSMFQSIQDAYQALCRMLS